jgi:hypothetical protein
MATIVPIYNTDEQQTQYNASFPPHYTATITGLNDKPPTYEQSVQQLSETNNTSENAAAILPISTVETSTIHPVQPSRNQT